MPYFLLLQIRAYTVQVPLPGVPTYVVALIASNGNETAEQLAALHQSFLKIADESGLSILSMGSDGAAVEVSAQEKINI